MHLGMEAGTQARIEQAGGVRAVDQVTRILAAHAQRRDQVRRSQAGAQRRDEQRVEHGFVDPPEAFHQGEVGGL